MNELYVGTGKRFAKELIADRRARGHRVYCISGQAGEDTFQVDWHTITAADIHKITRKLPELDVVLFNQNASSLSKSCFESDQYPTLDLWRQIDHWEQSYFVSCQMPFAIIHGLGSKLTEHSRIAWTLSSMITDHTHDEQYADYIAYKYQNYMLMKNFAHNHPGSFFGIDPGQITDGIATDQDFGVKISQYNQLLDQPNLNGQVWMIDGTVSKTTNLFG
jgi:hypothetical protein